MTAGLIVAAAIVAGWYLDVRWHPTRPCPACRGSRRNRGSRPAAWGNCGRCSKTGEVRRFGAGQR